MKKFNKINPITLAGMLLALSCSGIAIADATYPVSVQDSTVYNYSDNNYDGKQVRIAQPTGSSTNAQSKVVNLQVTPSKSTYRVNERMSFKVSGDDDYYLYVFNIDPNTNTRTVLIPNANTRDHHLRAHRSYTIPGTVEFYADRPGTERLAFIGTTEPLNLDRANLKQMGQFSTIDSMALDREVSNFDSKAIIVADPSDQNNRTAQNKVKLINLSIY